MGLSVAPATVGVRAFWGPLNFLCAVDRDDSAVCAFVGRVLRGAAVRTGAKVNFTPCARCQVSQEGCDLLPNVRWVLLPARGRAGRGVSAHRHHGSPLEGRRAVEGECQGQRSRGRLGPGFGAARRTAFLIMSPTATRLTLGPAWQAATGLFPQTASSERGRCIQRGPPALCSANEKAASD